MDLIAKHVDIFKHIIELYGKEYIQRDLNIVSDLVKGKFIRLLDEKSVNYNLTTTTSVVKSNYYHVESRIKWPNSLFEKFVRKDTGLIIIYKHDLKTSNDVAGKKEAIERDLLLLDDIIGIRIITELRRDCDEVYKLIKDNLRYFKDTDIVFKDLDTQPKTMKNGASIYNIKGIYNSKNAFELQIKSKISSAWGDMDHSLFYKDYSITPIRDTVQVSMNNIGKLLDELERFLYDLRKSNDDYSLKADYATYMDRFYEELNETLKDKFGFEYEIAKISLYLLEFLKHIRGEKEDRRLSGLDFSVLEYTCDLEMHRNYIKIRGGNFELMLLEVIYLNWVMIFEDVSINQENYGDMLSKYLEYIIELNSSKIMIEAKKYEQDRIIGHVRGYIEILMKYSRSLLAIIGHRTYLDALMVEDYINDTFDVEDGSEEIRYNVYIKKLLILTLFEADINSFMDDSIGDLDFESLNLHLMRIKSTVGPICESGKHENINIIATIFNGIKNIMEIVKGREI